MADRSIAIIHRHLDALGVENDVLRAQLGAMRRLANEALDALDAEKTPDYGVGHDRAHRALLAMLGREPLVIDGEMVTLDKLKPSHDLALALGDSHQPDEGRP